MKLTSISDWTKGKIQSLVCKPRRRPITTIVLHATAGSTASGAISTLWAKHFGYHALVLDQREEDGMMIKCVPDLMIAAHAGQSFGPQGSGVNAYSLGLSFVNRNDGIDPYSPKQHDSAVERCVSWCLAFPTIEWITDHRTISPGRKTDPRGFDSEGFVRTVNTRLRAKGHHGITFWKPRP